MSHVCSCVTYYMNRNSFNFFLYKLIVTVFFQSSSSVKLLNTSAVTAIVGARGAATNAGHRAATVRDRDRPQRAAAAGRARASQRLPTAAGR